MAIKNWLLGESPSLWKVPTQKAMELDKVRDKAVVDHMQVLRRVSAG